MRELKFRAWDKKENKMFNISSLSWKDGMLWACDAHGNNKLEYELAHLPDESDLMQCIGMKDKRGKDIYEGDIVKWSEKHLTDGGESIKEIKDVGAVLWSTEFAMFGLQGKELGRWQFYEDQEYEVLGNIYENQEMLK